MAIHIPSHGVLCENESNIKKSLGNLYKKDFLFKKDIDANFDQYHKMYGGKITK